MIEIIKKILSILADYFSYMKNKQLMDAGKNELSNQIQKQEDETAKKIQEIKNTVSNMPNSDIEQLLNIKITNKQ